MNRPAIEELKQWLTEPLEKAFESSFDKLEFLSRADNVVDGTTVYKLQGVEGQFRAVVLCSAPASPDLVMRSMSRALQAKKILDAADRVSVLNPLFQGRIKGLSYAVLPYCSALSETRPVWWVQRALVSPPVFDWLWRAAKATVRDVAPSAIDRSFSAPLNYLISIKSLDPRLKAAASLAIERLASGKWQPRHVMMHGDLWKGNILIRQDDRPFWKRKLADRFVIIDWGGSEVSGYAIYDLVRLAQSMRLSKRKLQREVSRHCNLLKCEPVDAVSYLMAALGFIAMNLENFPAERFKQMSDACYSNLAQLPTGYVKEKFALNFMKNNFVSEWICELSNFLVW